MTKKKKPLKLTPRNYYTSRNTAISNTKVGHFLKSKEYYKALYIDKTEVFTPTTSMKIGSMVDHALSTGSIKSILKVFEIKVQSRENKEKYQQQKEADPRFLVDRKSFLIAAKVAEKVLNSPLYQWYQEHGSMTQVIMQDRYFDTDVCGIADCVTVVGDTVYLDDWKTCRPTAITSPKRWVHHCRELGYFRQMAHYKNMLSKTFGDKNIVCRHIAMTNDSMYPKVMIYQITDDMLAGYLEEFKETVAKIVMEKDWVDSFPDHTKPVILMND